MAMEAEPAKKAELPSSSSSSSLVLTKYTLYETKTRLFIVGTTTEERRFKIAKIDRTDPSRVDFQQDGHVYSKSEMVDLLRMVDEGNKSTGGLEKVCSFFGIIGFIKFLAGYYLVLITRRSAVALIGGHYIYHIDDSTLISLSSPMVKIDRKIDEQRYLQIFSSMDLSKNFYFSYTYNLTRTLQYNLTRYPPPPPEMPRLGASYFDWNDSVVWNHYLLTNGFDLQLLKSDWSLPVIYGFVDQVKLSIFGHNLHLTLIGRRSRYFAGARFLKRGTNNRGYVANDVETEQIVHDAMTTSLYIGKPNYTSFVQHRGSIPLYWGQDVFNLTPKPPIELNVVDPYFQAAAKHFNMMLERYGYPIIVLNLVKSKERIRRESILLDEFTQCVDYLNQFLPEDRKIRYIAWDMARASKSENEDVIATLEQISQEILAQTGFFHSAPETYLHVLQRGENSTRILGRRQNGVVRTNCVDCLDRTNAAQFVIGKTALSYQLYALGVIEKPTIAFDCDVTNLLNAMYHDHGDTIALQYGGSHLVNTMETYRKISPWTSHSRDMIESIRRYYSNSFADKDKQEAMNLFLGAFSFSNGPVEKHIWELESDAAGHNESWEIQRRRKKNYIKWYDPRFLEPPKEVEIDKSRLMTTDDQGHLCYRDGFFNEYYRPRSYTSFQKLFAFNMISSLRVSPREIESYDFSPFKVRVNSAQANSQFMLYSLNIGGVKRILTVPQEEKNNKVGNNAQVVEKIKDITSNIYTSPGLATKSLVPDVAAGELREYRRYVNQFRPAQLTLQSLQRPVPPKPVLTGPYSRLPPTSPGPVSNSSSAMTPDLDIFQSYVVRSRKHEYSVSDKDEAAYERYLWDYDRPERWLGRQKEYTDNNDISVKEGYDRWLRTGRWVGRRSKAGTTTAGLARVPEGNT